MKNLNAFELINVAGGDNCLCHGETYSGNDFFKTNEIDGPSCVISCCNRVISSERYSWIWFGKEYSTQGNC